MSPKSYSSPYLFSIKRRLEHRADDLGERHCIRPGHPQPSPQLPPVLPAQAGESKN